MASDIWTNAPQRLIGRGLDFVVCSPLVRWTWGGLADPSFPMALNEVRPADAQMIEDMMAGRYVLAGRVVDTGGLSPFSIDPQNRIWEDELESFSWLRHFANARSGAEISFARTLILAWISRRGHYQRHYWNHRRTAIRVMNWLRHLPLILDGAVPAQDRAVKRNLAIQIQMLKMRAGFARRPEDNLLASIALLGAALCDGSVVESVSARARDLARRLAAEIGPDGLHLSRNAMVQIDLLTELASLRQNLYQRPEIDAEGVLQIADRMHVALDLITLPTGEPAFFNGAGPVPVDLVMALQSQSMAKRPRSGIVDNYGVLKSGRAGLVADAGQVPPANYGRRATASALALEFSHGGELVLCSCGPLSEGTREDRNAFRLGAAHSGPTIDGASSALLLGGVGTGTEFAMTGAAPRIRIEPDEPMLVLRTSAFEDRFGVQLERRLTLLADGDTLVGRDKVISAAKGVLGRRLQLRFHLAPRTIVSHRPGEQIVRLTLQSGAEWSFLWEGADVEIDESTRLTGHFGLVGTQQIVVSADLIPDAEIAWILTHQAS